MAYQPGYLGVSDAVPRRSRLQALIALSTTILALAILIFVVVFAVFGLRDNAGDGKWIPVAAAVGISISVVVAGIILFFLKWWECVRSRYPSMPGNRRHGYRMDMEPINSYADFRALDSPTKIGVVANAVGRWIDGLAMALFPCRDRDRLRKLEDRNRERMQHPAYEMSRAVEQQQQQPPGPRRVSATLSSQGHVVEHPNSRGDGESRRPSDRAKFNSFDSVVNKKGILKDGERQSRQASTSSQAAAAGAAAALRDANDPHQNNNGSVPDERPRVPSIDAEPPSTERTIQHPPPTAHRQAEFTGRNARWDSVGDETFRPGSQRTRLEPVAAPASPRDRHGSMQSDASQNSTRSTTYRPHSVAEAPSSLRSSISSVRLDNNSPGMMYAPLAVPQRHDRLSIPDVSRDLPPRGGISGISTLPSQRGRHRGSWSSRAGMTARPQPPPDLRRYSAAQMEQSLRDEGAFRPLDPSSRRNATDILEQMERDGRGSRVRSTQDIFQDTNQRR
ncbi:hypothetical protein SODALDRAFT_334003 [Sodiomyces alkalinus F11]|uniref:Uncharacterized protein n=1 Tax=Sodiomyces alkalinus (strain CBS 110278 / VKM F-3762 / F11) TaxID=1314773 RepID=A0A3N2PUP9_SODAK|nr:hypothetical protein SODALDRAFT_334003 [Sodiomyces alkalinus F11]ROT38235.1 hypothetical protein SODALDRAFT_334003 [Sodiomyces alkalinus F11]